MKKTHLIIALAMFAALTVAGCKNNNKKSQEPSQEEIQAQKQALADSVLAAVDSFAEKYIDASQKGFTFRRFELTDAEKMVKPDYLLDPAEANKFVTKSQKINALAIYLHELFVREIYDMPLEEAKEAAAKLEMEVNYPVDRSKIDENAHSSAFVKAMYEEWRKSGDLAYFWQFSSAILAESAYLIAQNPDLFISKITEEEYQAFCDRWTQLDAALEKLSEYDEEMRQLWEFRKETRVAQSPEDTKAKWGNLEAVKQSYRKYGDKLISNRNALLQ